MPTGQNRMILGDSLQVMASLAEREGLRGRVQCIYIDPPYGIKFNSNFNGRQLIEMLKMEMLSILLVSLSKLRLFVILGEMASIRISPI